MRSVASIVGDVQAGRSHGLPRAARVFRNGHGRSDEQRSAQIQRLLDAKISYEQALRFVDKYDDDQLLEIAEDVRSERERVGRLPAERTDRERSAWIGAFVDAGIREDRAEVIVDGSNDVDLYEGLDALLQDS